MSSKISIKEAKVQLRKAVKKKLKHVSNQSLILQSDDVTEKLIQTDYFRDSKKIAIFMNMQHLEIQTLQLIRHCFESKKSVFLPKCNGENNESYLSMLKMHSFEDVTKLQPDGKYGLLEPKNGENVFDEGGLDLIVVPGVAFTKFKARLGHGVGYYDKFFDMYLKKFGKTPQLIGVGLKEQLVEDIPMEDHDWSLDCVIISGYDAFI
ncbi:uncharacterized protein PRCAT00003995001 [Priceomyces carsonii]|uniref:uncharacterized protein n=1 Tax=Priceomyces carsonii TaxID=28549 RepID=UPI002ED92906|nr:unnamed protein product [Priceomyces carsonii]